MNLRLRRDPARVVQAKIDAELYGQDCGGSGTPMRAVCGDGQGHGHTWCWCCQTGVTATPVGNGVVRLDQHPRGGQR